MKRGNLQKWTNVSECTNLLLFSQLVNELLFDYSIPSNRVSTLNSHYLCLDAISAIQSIEDHGVPNGTLRPIMEELYSSLIKDPVFENVSPKPTDYFVKYSGDKYNLSKAVDMNYQDLRKCALAINSRFFRGDSYYQQMRKMIIDIIENNKIEAQKELFRLVKAMLTELMNKGYSLRYIFEIMKNLFWNSGVNIGSCEVINSFFDEFNLEKQKYEVVCKVDKKKMIKFMRFIDDIKYVDQLLPKTHSHSEKQFLYKSNSETFLRLNMEALDPFSAIEKCVSLLNDNISLYRLYDHGFRYGINELSCGAYSGENFYKIKRAIGATEHTKAVPEKQLVIGWNQFEKALKSVNSEKFLNDFLSIINAARFHSNSLNSESEENQLLDLWAIFESVLNISNEHTADRINQVCMYLVPILKRKYIYSLFEQLANDIKNYDTDLYCKVIGDAKDLDAIVYRVCEFTLIDNEERNAFIEHCDDFPLLKERIEYYKEALADTSKIYSFVEKHAERVRWQVMRIYRNRNLIIHNSKSMPYLMLLIENLHSYVDSFLTYTISNMAEGQDMDSICQDLFVRECEWNVFFQRKNRCTDEEVIQKMLSL